MLRAELICLTNSGISSVRITTVRLTIDMIHVTPESAPKIGLHNVCAPTRIAETAAYSGVMMAFRKSQNPSGTSSAVSIAVIP